MLANLGNAEQLRANKRFKSSWEYCAWNIHRIVSVLLLALTFVSARCASLDASEKSVKALLL